MSKKPLVRDLEEVARLYRPVLVFDTIERLERAADPTQQEFGYMKTPPPCWLVAVPNQPTPARSYVVARSKSRADFPKPAKKR